MGGLVDMSTYVSSIKSSEYMILMGVFLVLDTSEDAQRVRILDVPEPLHVFSVNTYRRAVLIQVPNIVRLKTRLV